MVLSERILDATQDKSSPPDRLEVLAGVSTWVKLYPITLTHQLSANFKAKICERLRRGFCNLHTKCGTTKGKGPTQKCIDIA